MPCYAEYDNKWAALTTYSILVLGKGGRANLAHAALHVKPIKRRLYCNFILTELIPYGWGHEGARGDGDNNRDEGIMASSRGGAGVVVRSISDVDYDNPHEAMAMEMAGKAPVASEEEEDIGSDIFDESTRYSNVDRPRLKVDHSSPTRTEQRRGSFMDEERISNFFRKKP